jgi:hypothetical protein
MKNNLWFLKLCRNYEYLVWFTQSVRILYWESILSGSALHKNIYAHICNGLVFLVLRPYKQILRWLSHFTRTFSIL